MLDATLLSLTAPARSMPPVPATVPATSGFAQLLAGAAMPMVVDGPPPIRIEPPVTTDGEMPIELPVPIDARQPIAEPGKMLPPALPQPATDVAVVDNEPAPAPARPTKIEHHAPADREDLAMTQISDTPEAPPRAEAAARPRARTATLPVAPEFLSERSVPVPPSAPTEIADMDKAAAASDKPVTETSPIVVVPPFADIAATTQGKSPVEMASQAPQAIGATAVTDRGNPSAPDAKPMVQAQSDRPDMSPRAPAPVTSIQREHVDPWLRTAAPTAAPVVEATPLARSSASAPTPVDPRTRTDAAPQPRHAPAPDRVIAAAPRPEAPPATDRLFRTRPNTAFADDAQPVMIDAAPIVAAPAPTPREAPVLQPATAPVDTTRADWMQSTIERIETLTGETGTRETRITLSPDALGTVEVKLREDAEGRMTLDLDAVSPEARLLLAEAAPRLTEMAEARGLRLSTQTANSQQFEGQQPGHREPPRPQSDAPTPNRRAARDAVDPQSDERIA